MFIGENTRNLIQQRMLQFIPPAVSASDSMRARNRNTNTMEQSPALPFANIMGWNPSSVPTPFHGLLASMIQLMGMLQTMMPESPRASGIESAPAAGRSPQRTETPERDPAVMPEEHNEDLSPSVEGEQLMDTSLLETIERITLTDTPAAITMSSVSESEPSEGETQTLLEHGASDSSIDINATNARVLDELSRQTIEEIDRNWLNNADNFSENQINTPDVVEHVDVEISDRSVSDDFIIRNIGTLEDIPPQYLSNLARVVISPTAAHVGIDQAEAHGLWHAESQTIFLPATGGDFTNVEIPGNSVLLHEIGHSTMGHGTPGNNLAQDATVVTAFSQDLEALQQNSPEIYEQLEGRFNNNPRFADGLEGTGALQEISAEIFSEVLGGIGPEGYIVADLTAHFPNLSEIIQAENEALTFLNMSSATADQLNEVIGIQDPAARQVALDEYQLELEFDRAILDEFTVIADLESEETLATATARDELAQSQESLEDAVEQHESGTPHSPAEALESDDHSESSILDRILDLFSENENKASLLASEAPQTLVENVQDIAITGAEQEALDFLSNTSSETIELANEQLLDGNTGGFTPAEIRESLEETKLDLLLDEAVLEEFENINGSLTPALEESQRDVQASLGLLNHAQDMILTVEDLPTEVHGIPIEYNGTNLEFAQENIDAIASMSPHELVGVSEIRFEEEGEQIGDLGRFDGAGVLTIFEKDNFGDGTAVHEVAHAAQGIFSHLDGMYSKEMMEAVEADFQNLSPEAQEGLDIDDIFHAIDNLEQETGNLLFDDGTLTGPFLEERFPTAMALFDEIVANSNNITQDAGFADAFKTDVANLSEEDRTAIESVFGPDSLLTPHVAREVSAEMSAELFAEIEGPEGYGDGINYAELFPNVAELVEADHFALQEIGGTGASAGEAFDAIMEIQDPDQRYAALQEHRDSLEFSMNVLNTFGASSTEGTLIDGIGLENDTVAVNDARLSLELGLAEADQALMEMESDFAASSVVDDAETMALAAAERQQDETSGQHDSLLGSIRTLLNAEGEVMDDSTASVGEDPPNLLADAQNQVSTAQTRIEQNDTPVVEESSGDFDELNTTENMGENLDEVIFETGETNTRLNEDITNAAGNLLASAVGAALTGGDVEGAVVASATGSLVDIGVTEALDTAGVNTQSTAGAIATESAAAAITEAILDGDAEQAAINAAVGAGVHAAVGAAGGAIGVESGAGNAALGVVGSAATAAITGGNVSQAVITSGATLAISLMLNVTFPGMGILVGYALTELGVFDPSEASINRKAINNTMDQLPNAQEQGVEQGEGIALATLQDSAETGQVPELMGLSDHLAREDAINDILVLMDAVDPVQMTGINRQVTQITLQDGSSIEVPFSVVRGTGKDAGETFLRIGYPDKGGEIGVVKEFTSSTGQTVKIRGISGDEGRGGVTNALEGNGWIREDYFEDLLYQADQRSKQARENMRVFLETQGYNYEQAEDLIHAARSAKRTSNYVPLDDEATQQLTNILTASQKGALNTGALEMFIETETQRRMDEPYFAHPLRDGDNNVMTLGAVHYGIWENKTSAIETAFEHAAMRSAIDAYNRMVRSVTQEATTNVTGELPESVVKMNELMAIANENKPARATSSLSSITAPPVSTGASGVSGNSGASGSPPPPLPVDKGSKPEMTETEEAQAIADETARLAEERESQQQREAEAAALAAAAAERARIAEQARIAAQFSLISANVRTHAGEMYKDYTVQDGAKRRTYSAKNLFIRMLSAGKIPTITYRGYDSNRNQYTVTLGGRSRRFTNIGDLYNAVIATSPKVSADIREILTALAPELKPKPQQSGGRGK